MRDQDVAKRIGDRLKTLREAQGLTQRAMARKAGLPPEVVSRILRGVYTPSIATLERLCLGLGISMAEFFSDAAVATPSPGAAPDATTVRLQRLLADLPEDARRLVVAGLESVTKGLARRRAPELLLQVAGLPVVARSHHAAARSSRRR